MCKLCEELGLDSDNAGKTESKTVIALQEMLAKNATTMADSLTSEGGKEAWLQAQREFLDARVPGLSVLVDNFTEDSLAAEQISTMFGLNPTFTGKVGLNLTLVRTILEAIEAKQA